MKQKHTKAKKARRLNIWDEYQFRSGQAFASYFSKLSLAPHSLLP